MNPWAIIGWVLLGLMAINVLGRALVALGRVIERQTAHGRIAQACRDMTTALRKRGL